MPRLSKIGQQDLEQLLGYATPSQVHLAVNTVWSAERRAELFALLASDERNDLMVRAHLGHRMAMSQGAQRWGEFLDWQFHGSPDRAKAYLESLDAGEPEAASVPVTDRPHMPQSPEELAMYARGAADALEGTGLVAIRREDLARLITEFRACTCPHEMCPVYPHPEMRKAAELAGWTSPEGEQL